MNEAKMTIAEAAYKALKESKNDTLSLDEILEIITKNSYCSFKEGVDRLHILRSQLERKCLNSRLADSQKHNVLFYRTEDGQYGLVEKLSPKELREYAIRDDEQRVIKKELLAMKQQLDELKSGLDAIKKVPELKDAMEDKANKIEDRLNESFAKHNEMDELYKRFKEEEDKVKNLLDGLNSAKHELNFDHLGMGFKSQLHDKKVKKRMLLITLCIGGLLILALPIIGMQHKINFASLEAMPWFGIEILSIYYFRIVLYNFNSIGEQILQIETKVSLLGFISAYMSFKKDNDIKHDEINKFEEVIFGTISPNMKDIPTSLDIASVAEKIAKIIRK